MTNSNNNPIGVFDSGVGGLTVLAALQEQLPNESFIYIGDTARVPYGNKPLELVAQYAEQISAELKDRGCKAVVIACNSASTATNFKQLEEKLAIPIIGVINATVEEALTHNGRIGVIGTSATISSNAYGKRIKAQNREHWSRACPLFAPIVEEGLADDKVAMLTTKHYLNDIPMDIESLILGCTHYPYLKHTIQEFLPKVHLVDSAHATAKRVKDKLKKNDALTNAADGTTQYFATGDVITFKELAQRLGQKAQEVQHIPLVMNS